MKKISPEQQERRIIRGREEIADYKTIPDRLPEYRDNPFIEALPQIWDWEEDEPKVVDELTQYFAVDESIRTAPMPIRQHRLGMFKLQFFQVTDRVRDLEINTSILLRQGYLMRNPLNARYRRELHDRLQEFKPKQRQCVSVGNLGLTLLGAPGCGKTKSLERIFLLYPQIISHRNYLKEPTFVHKQVVWLYLTCPHDSSTKGLCSMFFEEVDAVLGSNYCDRYSGLPENLQIVAMASVAVEIGLGALIVDEIEFLKSSRGEDDLLTFLVQVENTLRIPIILVGTCRAARRLCLTPHQARRSVGTGGSVWLPFRPSDQDWTIFLEAMWEHQFLRNYTPLTPEIAAVIYDETCGIPDYAVVLHYYSQMDAMNNKTETLTVDGIKAAARGDHMLFNRPYVDAMKRPEKRKYAKLLEDIFPPNFENCDEFFADRLNLPPQAEASDVSLSGAKQGGTSAPPVSKDTPIPGFQPPGPGSTVTGTISSRRKRGKGEVKTYPTGSIMAICSEALQKCGKAPYEALREAGLIVDMAQLLREPASSPQT